MREWKGEYFIRSDKADFEELFQMVKPFEKKIKYICI